MVMIMNLQEFFTIHPKIGIAFSGGTDSAFLLYEAKKYAKDVHAFFLHSAFQPSFEYEDALLFADKYNITLTVVETDILSDQTVKANPADRCYYCKRTVFTKIMEKAAELGVTDIADGTNASDDISDRPGFAALTEAGIYSPLRICGLTKEMIRKRSQEYGLFTGTKPSYACLATRIPSGYPITLKDLHRIEVSETYLMELGFSDFRIRLLPETCPKDTGKLLPSAKIQIPGSFFPLAIEKRAKILSLLSPYFSSILLDLTERNITG